MPAPALHDLTTCSTTFSFLSPVAYQKWLGHSCKGSTYVNLPGNNWDIELLKRFSEVLRSNAQSMVLTASEDIWHEHLIIILVYGLYTIWCWLYCKIQTIQTSVGPLYPLPPTTESACCEHVFQGHVNQITYLNCFSPPAFSLLKTALELII